MKHPMPPKVSTGLRETVPCAENFLPFVASGGGYSSDSGKSGGSMDGNEAIIFPCVSLMMTAPPVAMLDMKTPA